MASIMKTFTFSWKFYIWFLLTLFSVSFAGVEKNTALFEAFSAENIPVAFKGRFRHIDPYAKLWLYDIYHSQQVKKEHRHLLGLDTRSATEIVWPLLLLGHAHWDEAPLFWIHDSQLKAVLKLDSNIQHFSYQQLYQAIYEDKAVNVPLLQTLLTHEYLKKYRDPQNRGRAEKQELTQLSPGLWLQFHGNDLVVTAAPKNGPWHFLEEGALVAKNGRYLESGNRALAESTLNLLTGLSQFAQLDGLELTSEIALERAVQQLRVQGTAPQDIALIVEMQFPVKGRLSQASDLLKVLPGYKGEGEWYSLKALKIKVYDPQKDQLVSVGNFTLYPDAQFEAIRTAYIALENLFAEDLRHDQIRQQAKLLAKLLHDNYAAIAGKSYKHALDKALYYPSYGQLKAESFYYHYPLVEIAIVGYALAVIAFLLAMTLKNLFLDKWGVALMLLAFCLHTVILALRCYILARSPVSNMFETVIYVPWIAVAISFLLRIIWKHQSVLLASSIVAALLLSVLQFTDINSGLENVQAVLDSQYWLIIHVLMVVGSYGAFALCGVLGHLYLISYAVQNRETPAMAATAKLTLQAMYIGLAMLIPGTILGGIWAAESWGRFWDWDPKESWAFISICVYLIWIHAYTFHHVRHFGLAVGAVIGLQAISFTWYGVNYILGTGLHSYGFGSGGEIYYYLFLVSEAIFLGLVINRFNSLEKKSII